MARPAKPSSCAPSNIDVDIECIGDGCRVRQCFFRGVVRAAGIECHPLGVRGLALEARLCRLAELDREPLGVVANGPDAKTGGLRTALGHGFSGLCAGADAPGWWRGLDPLDLARAGQSKPCWLVGVSPRSGSLLGCEWFWLWWLYRVAATYFAVGYLIRVRLPQITRDGVRGRAFGRTF